MQAHADHAWATDGAGDRAEVSSVVGASVAYRLGRGADRSRIAADRQQGRNSKSLPRALGVWQLIQVILCRLLIGWIGAGHDLTVIDVVERRVAVVSLRDSRVGARRALPDLCLVLRNVGADRVGDVEDVE